MALLCLQLTYLYIKSNQKKMKQILIGILVASSAVTACTNNDTKSANTQTTTVDSNSSPVAHDPADDSIKLSIAIREIVTAYLEVKNGFVNDNSAAAAKAATSLKDAFDKVNKSALTETQKTLFEDVVSDATEHAEHISKNSGKIEHQRGHFKSLSEDIYDLIKSFGAGQTLYKDFCPMYNDNKGAFWLSETKAIRNPYLGKAMPDCGLVKEELK
jgi:hypothetical protein